MAHQAALKLTGQPSDAGHQAKWCWGQRDEASGSGGEAKKAASLRAEITLTTDWIAKRLHNGTRGYLDRLLRLQRKTNAEYGIIKNCPLYDPLTPPPHLVDPPSGKWSPE